MNNHSQQFDCLKPFTPCWCEQHPNINHPKCKTSVPINNGIFILFIIGILFGINKIRKYNSLTEDK